MAKSSRSSSNSDFHEDDYHSFSGSYTCTESDEDWKSEYNPSTKRLKTYKLCNETVVERRPTRVPNKNITNRNALLARENRKRKKEEMEQLQNENAELEAENRKLIKVMKKKDAQLAKLVQEIKYMKSVIANRTTIGSLLKSISQNCIAFPNAAICHQYDSVSTASDETLSCSENGKAQDPFLSFLSAPTDNISLPEFDVETDFSELLKFPEPDFNDSPSSMLGIENKSCIDHNYSYDKEKETVEDQPGICLHINSGRVSVEFCASCSSNSSMSS